MIYKDYYKDLGIGTTATPEEIKKAYRRLANKYHPDKAKVDKTAEEKFKDINEANEVLSDPEKRKKYDQFGAEWKHYEEAGAQPQVLIGRSMQAAVTGQRIGQVLNHPIRCLRTKVSTIFLECSLDNRVDNGEEDGTQLLKARILKQRQPSHLMKHFTERRGLFN
ncbi:MAG: hypothetical protein EPO24_09170 [Bacteroidetes bacterium]|nr:MAG: hypothetical protein EPO24_09170 [Bacteroidota bacterium]